MMLVLAGACAVAQVSGGTNQSANVVQPTLIAPGGVPFHLKAAFAEAGDKDPVAEVEMYWVAPDKWRRTIESDEYSQTLIVDGEKVFEEETGDYLPLGWQTLLTAMVDPKPALAALMPGDYLLTKSNGHSDESGVTCIVQGMCVRSPYGLRETVGATGHSVEFTDYQEFKGKRVARRLYHSVGVSEGLGARVTDLKELKEVDSALFAMPKNARKGEQLRSVEVPEAELRSLALNSVEIIWPQVLDGAEIGKASFYVSIDRSGRVREVIPLHTDNERSNDSARRQMMKWKFKPVVKDGSAVQAASLMNFNLNTRAWGPKASLNNEEVRKLATNIVEPEIPPGTYPAGTVYTLRAAIDSDGRVIEVIAGDGPPKLFRPCYGAMSKWHFSPIMENGEPRPYRAEIRFVVQ